MSDDPNEHHRHMFMLIGLYMVHWSTFELAVDIATVKLSGTTAAHIVQKTGGKSVAMKVEFLRQQVEEIGHPETARIVKLLDTIPNQSIRNSIAHSYMRFGIDKVAFIHRKSGARVTVHEFTGAEFGAHISQMASLADELSEIFHNTDADAENFIAAATS